MPPWIWYGIPGRTLGKHEQHFQSVPARRHVDYSLRRWPTFMYSFFHMRGECASPDSMSVGYKGKALVVVWGVGNYGGGGGDQGFWKQLRQNLITKSALMRSSSQPAKHRLKKQTCDIKKSLFRFASIIKPNSTFNMFESDRKKQSMSVFHYSKRNNPSFPLWTFSSLSPVNKCSIIHRQWSGKSPGLFILPNQTGYHMFYGCGQRENWTISHVTGSWVCTG